MLSHIEILCLVQTALLGEDNGIKEKCPSGATLFGDPNIYILKTGR